MVESFLSLSSNPLLRSIPLDEIHTCASYFEYLNVPAQHKIVREGNTDRSMYLIIEGEAQVLRNGARLGHLQPDFHFGELSLLTHQPRAATVLSLTPMKLAKLTSEQFERLTLDYPSLALHFMRSMFANLRTQLTSVTDSLEILMRKHHLPRRTELKVQINGDVHWVKTGTPIRELLPTVHQERLVVAALSHRKAVSLHQPIVSDAVLSPLTIGHWEGFRIYRRSLGLLLLEAALQLDPPLICSLGSPMGFAQVIDIDSIEHRDSEELARLLSAQMAEIAGDSLTFTTEQWPVEEAMVLLQAQGWGDAAALLSHGRGGVVTLASCGSVYVPYRGPMVPDTSFLRGFSITTKEDQLLMYFGDRDTITLGGTNKLESKPLAPSHSVPYIAALNNQHTMHAQRQWLDTLRVPSVGEFNQRCVSGHVSTIIRVSEGFHEKRIGQIADQIAARPEIRVISIAGPSSAGKSTFIKRLNVQLQVNGISPCDISMDDYYVDRVKTVKDENGEYDFEALEAIDLRLFHGHLKRLMAGEEVTLARYDFVTGTSDPNGGAQLQLEPNNVLVLEGLHGMNPKILPNSCLPEQVYRIFVNPMSSLPFDPLSRLHVSDLRLLRRIVRDRHNRAINAAENITRWTSVRRGERASIYPFLEQANTVFDSSLIYEPSVLKVFADRYLLEVPRTDPAFTTAFRLRQLLEQFVTIYPDHVPPNSLLREFIGGSGFEY